MATRISDAEMTSTDTRHTARAAEGGGWTVSWLPGRTFTQGQAVTAMTIAEAVIVHADDLADNGSRWWLHIDGWAAELGTTGPHAVAAASEPPEAHAAEGDEWFGASVMHSAAQPGAYGHAEAAGGADVSTSEDEPLPDLSSAERLELLGVMDPDDMRTSLAFIVSQYPQVFDFALVRDRKLLERLQDRLDHQYDDDPEPYCSACGANIGIFIGHGDAWLHYTGQGTVESPVDLYDAGHEPVIAWREAGCAVSAELAQPTGAACHYCHRTGQQLKPCCEHHPDDLVCADVAGCRDYLLGLLNGDGR